MYHGAVHNRLTAWENGKELTVENVRIADDGSQRCGQSFSFDCYVCQIFVFMFIVVGNVWLRMVLRILLIPVIALACLMNHPLCGGA